MTQIFEIKLSIPERKRQKSGFVTKLLNVCHINGLFFLLLFTDLFIKRLSYAVKVCVTMQNDLFDTDRHDKPVF